jgi:DNA-directed RNA polymerase beta subunit
MVKSSEPTVMKSKSRVKDGQKTYRSYKPVHFSTKQRRPFYQPEVTRVTRGDKVKKGDILIEGASIADGELALGRDLVCGIHAMERLQHGRRDHFE